MMLRHSIRQQPKLLEEIAEAARHCVIQKAFYANASRFHRHLTYSKIGTNVPRKPVVDPKMVKVGDPISASVMLGDMTEARKFEFDLAALNARGFLRFQKSYTPPANADESVLRICRACLKVSDKTGNIMAAKLDDPRLKYELLTKTFEQFQHGIPNSLLHMISTVGDLVEFYCTPVNTQTPFEELVRNPDLPQNLYIQKEPVRFHPDTDTMFGGQSAYPKSSTMVTNLRAKKKYRGYEAKMTWP